MQTDVAYRNLFDGTGSGPGTAYEPPSPPDFTNSFSDRVGRHTEFADETYETADADSETGEEPSKAAVSDTLSETVLAFLTAIQEMGIETMLGTDSDDKLSGWTNSAIVAGDGDDVIKVWSDSAVDAGAGNDTIDAWSGSAIDAGAGEDTVRAWSDSYVSGGEGNDRIDIWSGSQAEGGSGDDIIHAWSETRVSGGAGNDRIDIWSDSYADAGAGDDVINAHSNTVVSGGSGNDTIDAHCDSRVDGGSGDDTIRVGSDSVVTGGTGSDTIVAWGGSDISGGAGDDWIKVTGEGSTIRFNAGDGYDRMVLGSGGTIQLGAGLNAENVQAKVEGNVATVTFNGSDDMFEVQMVPDKPVNVVFDSGETLALEPDDAFKVAYEDARQNVRQKLNAGEVVGYEDMKLLMI
ncbi:hypothetical protein [uncultured Roseibium sp.]|uniref:calcium-binding protein n=1 Tax=uncultured Roseibium sp. TaxID=1936171 RepID=UPI003216ADB9